MTINFKEVIANDMAESGFNVHNDLKGLTVPELREICDENRAPFSVALMNVTGDMNCGSIIRTASLFGAQKVIVFGRKKFDRRGLVGTQNYIDIEFVPCLTDNLGIDEEVVFQWLKSYNNQVVMVEQGGLTLGDFEWRNVLDGRDVTFVMGNENRGIYPNVIDRLNDLDNTVTVSITQKGVIRSHNVSVATGIVLHDAMVGMDWK